MPYVDPDRRREYARDWMAKRRAEWFQANGPCFDCGTWEDLELDHIDPALKVSHRIWSWAKERREAELAKCVARCRSCHLKKTIKESQGPAHGTAGGYYNRKCRCDLCKKWMRDYKRDYRIRTSLLHPD